MSSHVRILNASDRKAWELLWQGYQDYYQVDLSQLSDNLFERLMDDNPDGPFALVYEDEKGELVGLAQFMYQITTWSPTRRCYLQDLYTMPHARGKGVGKALINAVYEKVDEAGASQVYWLTQDFNKAGRRLYDKVGKVTPFIKYQR